MTKNMRLVLSLIPAVLCAIPHAAQAKPVSSPTVTYTLTQNLPSIDGDSPTFTWTTGAIDGYETDGTPLPFLSTPTLNADATNDGYFVDDTPDVVYEDGSFVEVSLDYFYSENLFENSNNPACPAGSDQAGCTFSVAVDYEAVPDPPGFAPDPLNIQGPASVPEPASAVLVLLGGLGLVAARRLRVDRKVR